jgi:hypothetical protein
VAIYGTKQGANAWWHRSDEALQGLGCKRMSADPAAYVAKGKGAVSKFIHSHVDNFTIVGPSGETQKDVVCPSPDIPEKRSWDYSVPPRYRFERNKETGSINSTQPELLQDIVELLGLQQATRRDAPLSAETVLEIGTAPTLDAHAMSLYMTVEPMALRVDNQVALKRMNNEMEDGLTCYLATRHMNVREKVASG